MDLDPASPREQLRAALKALRADLTLFEDTDLDKLWMARYRNARGLLDATREGLKDAGLLPGIVDHILKLNGAAAGPSVATGRTPDAELSSFWNDLRKLEGPKEGPGGTKVLSLPDDMKFPGPFQDIRHLLCRKCYEVALKKMDEDVFEKFVSRFLILGTPGIGKSTFLLYLLFHLAKQGRTVVWWAPQSKDDEAILFTPDGAYLAAAPWAFKAELKDPATWFLHDAKDFPQRRAVTVMASSPRSDRYNMFAKTSHKQLWFGPWSLDELEAARQLEPTWKTTVTKEHMESLYDKWGGTPRMVLEQAKSTAITGAYDHVLAQANIARVMDTVLQMEGAGDDVSHKLLHIQADEHCNRGPVVFASEYVATRILYRVEVALRHKLQTFLATSAHNPFVASVRGVLFKGYGLTALARGGKFRVRDLSIPDSKPMDLELRSVVKQHVTDLSEASVGHLLIPKQSNFPAIDGLLVLPQAAEPLTPAPQVLLLQFTVSAKHNIKQTGLQSVLQQLPQSVRAMMTAFCFVVPSDAFLEYPAHRYTAARDKKLLQQPELVGIPQYVLEVPLAWGNAAMPAAGPPSDIDITMKDAGKDPEPGGSSSRGDGR